jgi:haloalkane dehalogenase
MFAGRRNIMPTLANALPADPAPALREPDFEDAFRRAPHQFLDVGHSRLAYWKFGGGPDLVFVHGWPLHAATFRRVLPYLADGFTCHLLDLPGTGQTQSDAGAPIDLMAHAATVRTAIDLLGLRSYALVAHDSGGFIARVVAAGDPRARGLVLGNTEIPGYMPPLVAMYAMMVKLPGGSRLLRLLMRSRWIRESALGFRGCFRDMAALGGAFHDFFVAPLLADGPGAEGQMQLLRTLRKEDFEQLRDVHGRIRVPVLLIWGDDDPFFPLDRARPMLGQFGGEARLDVIQGAKLFVHEDHPGEFAGLARPFLASLA